MHDGHIFQFLEDKNFGLVHYVNYFDSNNNNYYYLFLMNLGIYLYNLNPSEQNFSVVLEKRSR